MCSVYLFSIFEQMHFVTFLYYLFQTSHCLRSMQIKCVLSKQKQGCDINGTLLMNTVYRLWIE